MNKARKRWVFMPLTVIGAAVGLVVLFVLAVLIVIPMLTTGDMTSIYKSAEAEDKLMEIYDAKLAQWPEPYESVFVDTTYGRVHAIVSGPEDAPPLLLFHASGMSASSWVYNMDYLNQYYRTYAIDNLGEAGKSSLDDINNFAGDGEALCALYVEIAEGLGVEDAYVVGASNGGFIGTNYALYAPERVKKLALLGPMGYSSTTDMASFRIAMVAGIPSQSLRDGTVKWALGDDEEVLATTEEWFRYVMSGTFPRLARPTRFSPEQMESLSVPVLLVLGENDALLGHPEKASSLAASIPDVRIEVVDSGHLISVEQRDRTNELLHDFFQED